MLIFFFLPKEKYHSRTIYSAFDTVSQISVYSDNDNTYEYEKMLHTFHSQLDVHSKNSLISRLNSGEQVSLTPDIAELLNKSVCYSDILSDYFDITVNPVLESWNLAEEKGELPTDIEDKLALVGTSGLFIDNQNNTAKITREGASVSLGAIAKGFAAEKLVSQMKNDRVKSALINLGGNVYALGKKSDGTNWQVAVADPKNTASPLLSVSVCDLAVVTSGDYERFYEIDGKKYSHIIDPKTGYPTGSNLHSVTVIGDDSILCDVLSTAVFVAGKEEAKRLAEEFGVELILTDADTIYYTLALEEKITLYSNEYELCLL